MSPQKRERALGSTAVMEALLRDKFLRHPDLRAKLLATEERRVLHVNDFNDAFWGLRRADRKGRNELGEAVGRLKQLGGAMGQELASQNAMLSDLEAGLDETASGMDALKGKMRALLPKHEPKQKMAICCLSVLLIILVILVLS